MIQLLEIKTLNPENERICRMDKLVKLWRVDASSGHLLIGGTLSGHRRGIVDVAFSAHNQVNKKMAD